MPDADAVSIARCLSPVMPGAYSPRAETLAGAWIASVGTAVPSGRTPRCSVPADAVARPTPVRFAVQAADSRASGTSAVAFCKRLSRGADIFTPHRDPVPALPLRETPVQRARLAFSYARVT